MVSYKFQQNQTINEEFDFFEMGGRQEDTIYKCESQLLLVNI